MIGNILHCLKYGPQMGWLIDPEERLILAFIPGQEPKELTGQDILPMPKLSTSDLTVEQIFEWLKIGQ